MKIALLGYGKMGKAIETIAITRGHEIVTTIDNDAEWEQRRHLLKGCDVAIDFSMPSTAVDNIGKCFDLDLPVVVGTTGWYDHLDHVVEQCNQRGQALFVASNFSIGMNIMFDLNRRLAKLINRYDDYQVTIAETHHIHKLDAPSGTAITLARDIIERVDRLNQWHLVPAESASADSIAITAVREGEVPGVHEVVADSSIDTITLRHEAKSRKGLALGALLAAEYLVGRKGYFTMSDMLSE